MDFDWTELWDHVFLWNPLRDWALALVAFLVTFIVLPLVKSYIDARRRRRIEAGRDLPVAIDLASLLVARTSRVFLLTVALNLALTQLEFPYDIERVATIAIVASFWLQVGLWAVAAARFGLERRRRHAGGPDPALAGSFEFIIFIANLAIWGTVLLLALANLGVRIGPLLAGLGIGGIAVALAVQTVLGDLLASLSIALDKPFVVGDSLTIDNLTGTVEHIGVKSTRLRSVSGEQIVMSNADILKARVRNWGRMRERRVEFQIGVTYDTSADTLAALPGEIRRIVEAQDHARFDRCHFLSYAESSLQFVVVYFVLTANYTTYADIQQAINLAVFRRFEELGVKFAYPTRTVHVEGPAAEALQSSAPLRSAGRVG